jgi:hypothetical protein
MRSDLLRMLVIILLSSSFCMCVNAKKVKNMNVRISPEFLYGVLNAAVDFKIRRDAAIGITTECSTVFYKHCSVSGGVSVKYKRQDILTSGWILNPYLKYSYGDFSHGETMFLNESLGFTLGHQWVYRRGLNVRFGLGAQYNSAEELRARKVFPTMALTIGRIF